MLYISRFEFPDVETETDFRFGLKMHAMIQSIRSAFFPEKG